MQNELSQERERGKPGFYDLEIETIFPGIIPLQILLSGGKIFVEECILFCNFITGFSEGIRWHHWQYGKHINLENCLLHQKEGFVAGLRCGAH